MAAKFEILEHPADVGFVAFGATLTELFENAALALSSLACSIDSLEEREARQIVAQGSDTESLLYAWLAEILAIADAEQLVFRRTQVTHLAEPHNGIAGEVCGIAFGEKFDRARHSPGTYIKAVTFHQFRIEGTANGFRARVFLDV